MKYDYGVIKFPSSVSDKTGSLGLSTATPAPKSPITVQGYRIEGNTVYYKQYICTGEVKELTADLIRYENDTLSGQSGSPVMVDGYDNYNTAVRFTPTVINFLLANRN